MIRGLKVWNVIKKHLNFFHHRIVDKNSDIETVEGMSIDIIDKELQALEIIRNKKTSLVYFVYCCNNTYQVYLEWCKLIKLHEEKLTEEEFNLLYEVIL